MSARHRRRAFTIGLRHASHPGCYVRRRPDWPVPLALPAQRFTPAEGADPLHVPLDQILDVNVRDGLVYYRALKSDRGRLDRYVASLNVPAATYGGWTPDQQIAFWLNAYNAFVLETVIDNYPIRGRSAAAPATASSRSRARSSRRSTARPGAASRSTRSRRRSCRSSRTRGCTSRWAAAPSAAAGCAARRIPASASSGSSTTCDTSSSTTSR